MSISPPSFSPPRLCLNEEDNDDFVNVDDDQCGDSPRTLLSSFDLYKCSIDRLRSSVSCKSIAQQKSSLDDFKSLSTRTNAWLYMKIHDDLFSILLEYLLVDDLGIQSTVLSIFANIACEQASHEQILETNLIDIVCRKLVDSNQIDITNRCFRLLGNVCTVEDAARKMIDAELIQSMGNVLRTCVDPACLHSTIRCSRKLSTYAFCRERMLDSMCLLFICKQLFAEKVALRKEAMKAVLEWNIDFSDRSRSQLRDGEIFRFLMTTIESNVDKEYRHIAFRLLSNLLRYGDMRTEFGLRNGLDFLLKMIHAQQYQSTYEHLKCIGLLCVCCQEINNRRLIKDDVKKMDIFFNYLEKYQYRSNFLDLLLTAIGQFIYDEQSLLTFVKQMQFIERMCNLIESTITVKYESNEKHFFEDDDPNSKTRKRLKIEHTTGTRRPQQHSQRASVMIEFNESLFTEFVENTHLDDERNTLSSLSCQTITTNINMETRRRTEALIFTLLSKLSYETTDKSLRRVLYNRRLMSLLLRYNYLCDEPNPRAIRIIYRLTKTVDCLDSLIDLGLPYLIKSNFYSNAYLQDFSYDINTDDQYLLNILLNDNRAFFQRLSWTSEDNRLKTIENALLKNIESHVNTPYALNEIVRRLNDGSVNEKFFIMLTLVKTINQQSLTTILFEQSSGFRFLLDHSDEHACFWAFRTIIRRCLSFNNRTYIDEFLHDLQIHADIPTMKQTRNIELNINNEQFITVNSHLLCFHSDYFKTLFNGSFSESNQTTIQVHLPQTIAVDSYVHLINLLVNNGELIQYNRLEDLFHLCDEYLFDYLPYRLVHYVLEQFINGRTTDIINIASKPTLVPSLVRACFSHLLTSNTNVSSDLFIKLMKSYSEELRTLIMSFLKHECWYHNEYSPF